MKNLSILAVVIFFTGCASNQQLENSFDAAYLEQSATLTFSSPNFSAFHKPPLLSGFAYVESYSLSNLCLGDKNYVGKTTVSRSNKTLATNLPQGSVVLNVGYHAVGATGGGLTGNTYYLMDVDASRNYKITLTEARPLVTSYKITFESVSSEGNSSVVPVKELKTLTSAC